MPIMIPNGLPAAATLAEENIFVMNETRAVTQDIRPLQILVQCQQCEHAPCVETCPFQQKRYKGKS
mgnify:CR=1 FL=1